MKKVNLNSLYSNLVPKIFLAFLSLGVTVIKPCFAQSIIVPDNSLGNEASKVTPNINNLDGIPSELIEGGAERGQNLFHSFQEFNVNEGRGAYFVVPHDTIQNILTRVTGNNPSSINGILGTIANSNFAPTKANLFLINPNGIIFGKNASLDINGSFVGTTANAVELGGEGFFSATNPQTPSELLTVSPSALLFNQINAQASIQNNSVVDLRLNRGEDNFTPKGLRVGDGKSLLLVGGDISMDAGGLSAFGGHVELGGLADAGTVGLKVDRNNLSLSFPSGIERSDVFLSNGAGVRVTAGNGGSIAVNARNLEMTGESFLLAGIESELSSDDSKAGNIDINTTSAIKLNNQSNIVNQVQPEARGQGGDVNISASTLQVEGGSQLLTSTFGAGKGGNLIVDALDVQVIGTDTNGFSSSLSTFTYSTGDAGDLTIKTNTLLLRDGSEVSSATFSKGKGGNLTVDASDVQLIESRDGSAGGSILSTGSQRSSTGDSGDLTIKTNTLLVRDGAVVTASTFGEGNSGNLTIDATDVQVIGTSKDGLFNSALGVGAQPSSTGDTGDLTIKTNTLLVRDGGIVNATAFGTGKGGNLTIDATDVQVIGTGKDGFPSGLFAAELSNPSKDVGSLTIKTSTLLVRDGAQVGAGTFGASKGGNLTIDATDVQVIGTSKDGRLSSGLFASAEPNSTGDAGDLTIKTNALLVEDGAQVTTRTSGTGNGGNLIVDANTLQLKDAGNLNAQSSGTGKAGEININLKDNFNADNGQITTQAQQSSGGNINITAGKNIFLRNNSDIRTILSTTTGSGGNINLNANAIVALEDSDILAFAPEGEGGDITFNTRAFLSDTLFRPTPQAADGETLDALDGNNRVDVNASGSISTGTIRGIPDISFLQNSLTELAENPIDSEALIANSCVVRSNKRNGTFFITGKAGLPYRPGDAVSSVYSAVEVQPVSNDTSSTKPRPRWKIGDPIIEPTGVYRLENGQRILSRKCER